MTSGYIASGRQQLHYLRWDGGNKLLLAFHGYGNNALLFRSTARAVGTAYTTLSFDLPYHGQSHWEGNQPWQVQELGDMVRALMTEYGVSKISVVCFSIGGRIGLVLAEHYPEIIESLILIAADGLAPNYFYRFVTNNFAGKQLFHHFLKQPQGYMKLVDWLARYKWIDPSRKRFVAYYVDEPDARTLLRQVWPNLRLMIPDLRTVKKNISRYKIHTHLVMGRHDKVIPLRHAKIFMTGAPDVQLHLLEKGHRIMDEETALEVAKILLVS